MASLNQTGTNNGILRYVDDNTKNVTIVIAQITDYYRGGSGRIVISTARRSHKLQLNNKAAVDSAIALLDSIF